MYENINKVKLLLIKNLFKLDFNLFKSLPQKNGSDLEAIWKRFFETFWKRFGSILNTF
jgi:hypothetical protein